jgi:hypothetical protein
MKHVLRSFLHVCLMAVLLAPAISIHAADDAPAPDYQAVVNALFARADFVRIKGYVVDGIAHEINCTTTKAPSLPKLRNMFLAETPRYLGRDIPPRLGEHFSSRLEFTWVGIGVRMQIFDRWYGGASGSERGRFIWFSMGVWLAWISASARWTPRPADICHLQIRCIFCQVFAS